MKENRNSGQRPVPENILILGSGIAGYSTARAVQRAGRDVHVTMISEEPDPTYSACVFAEYIAGEIPRERVFIKDREKTDAPPWERIPGRKVERIDLEAKILDLEHGEPLPFDKLVLATGSSPLVPELPGIRKRGVYGLKTLAQADRVLQARGTDAVVVGSGPVGLELVVALRKRGWKVTVVELLDRLLPRLFSPLHALMIQALLEEQGVRVRLGERVQAIEGKDRVEAVVTDKQVLPCQLVLLGIGMRPEAGLAKRAGVRLGAHGGILVDPFMRTSHEDVFSCGDCVETMDRLSGKVGLSMLWGNAKMQGEVAGMNSLGLEKRYPGAWNLTTLKLYDTVSVSVGEVMPADTSFQEIVKHQGQRCAVRLVLREGLIKGIQAVGHRIDTSIFLNMMLCGERLNSLRESRDKRVMLGQKPWLVRLPPYLRE